MQKIVLCAASIWCSTALSVAQNVVDSIQTVEVNEIVVVGNAQQRAKRSSAITVETIDKEVLSKLFTGNLMNSIERIAGVQSMSIGSGFSKPMIRGMAFNRVSVTENGVKQEGQQWGADHGLEVDAFNIEKINIHKGPSSLLYGSDAMGGVIEILPPTLPAGNQVFGSVDLLGRSANGLLGGSLMVGLRHKSWFVKARYSEQHFGDFAVPTDTVVYLTQKLPLTNGRLNNTAGIERGANLYTRYGAGRFSAALLLSNAYQKVGFFAAAHGVPDAGNLVDDGNSRNIGLPYSFVNHFKTILTLKYFWDKTTLTWDLGYQNNHREELSKFHSHYGTLEPPEVNPDQEFAFRLNTYSSGVKAKFQHTDKLESTASWDVQYQRNRIAGYSFLLPNYERATSGIAWFASYRPSDRWTLSGGLRYDVGHISSDEYIDNNLVNYLREMGYDEETIGKYRVRSYAIDRTLGNYSAAVGAVYHLSSSQSLRANLGRSYRLPSVNELGSNGVHHGSFRHEQGDPTLDSEQGWQADLGYDYKEDGLSVSISPFLSWYQNYIYMRPSGEWSMLPHAGQIYVFSQSEALFAGAEASATVSLPWNFSYELSGEYTFTYNIDENTPLPLSPPTIVRSTLSWRKGLFVLSANWKWVADQERVARNEETTEGASLFGAALDMRLPFITKGATARLSIENVFDTKYLNHLSFYRQIEVPEMGRNIQLSIQIPFTNRLNN